MKAIDFIKKKIKKIREREIRVDGEILNIEEGYYVENKSMGYVNGHEISRLPDGDIIWKSLTINLPKKKTVHHSKLLILNFNSNNEKQQNPPIAKLPRY